VTGWFDFDPVTGRSVGGESTGPRCWLGRDPSLYAPEPQGLVRARLVVADSTSPFARAATVSFGDGVWYLLYRNGDISGVTWDTLLSSADEIVEFESSQRCRYAFAPPADYHWVREPEGDPPYRCTWPGHAPIGAHLIRGLAWLSESEHSVEVPDA
jgi:hypothetical protein